MRCAGSRRWRTSRYLILDVDGAALKTTTVLACRLRSPSVVVLSRSNGAGKSTIAARLLVASCESPSTSTRTSWLALCRDRWRRRSLPAALSAYYVWEFLTPETDPKRVERFEEAGKHLRRPWREAPISALRAGTSWLLAVHRAPVRPRWQRAMSGRVQRP
jgi:hypothetical protein